MSEGRKFCIASERTIKIAQPIVNIVEQVDNHNNNTTNQGNPQKTQGNQALNTHQ